MEHEGEPETTADEEYSFVDPDSREYYRDSPTRDDGLLDKAENAVSRAFGTPPEHRDTLSNLPEDTEALAAEVSPEPGTTDYATSNWSEDEGRAPHNSDVDIVRP